MTTNMIAINKNPFFFYNLWKKKKKEYDDIWI